MRSTLVIVAMLMLSSPPPATAQTTPVSKEAQQAEALHERALAAAKSRQWKDAIALWDTALSLNPVWKYAYNQALSHKYLKQWQRAWKSARQAQRLGSESNYAAGVEKVLQTAEGHLLKKHVLLRLRVVPTQAVVTLQEKLWSSPRERWVTRDVSTVVVKKEGYKTVTFTWEHPIGTRTDREIRLTEIPVPQEPAVDTKTVLPVQPVVATTPERRFQTMPWILLGSGVAAIAGGGGMFAWASSIVSDANHLNANPPQDMATYNERRKEFESQRKTAVYGGWTLTALGGAAVVTGLVLFLTNEPKAEPETATHWRPLVWPGGVGAQVQF